MSRNCHSHYRPIDLLRANIMLGNAVGMAHKDWERVLIRVAATLEKAKKYVTSVNEICDEHGFEPEGAIPGPTLRLRIPGVSEADHHDAFRLLRDCGRIQQVERGRGRALILWSDLPVEIEDIDNVVPTPWWETASTVFAMRPVTEAERVALCLPD